MARFDDYHRTVIGYHGTGLAAALQLVNRIESFKWSKRSYDWLGGGTYFREYAPKQALAWAMLRQKQFASKVNKTPEEQRRATEPLAVVASMIRLGFCLDLTEPENIQFLWKVFEEYKENLDLTGEPLPVNERHFRKLDNAVFNYAYALLEQSDESSTVDTARGVYVPQGGKRRVWEGSWISRDTHIQLCVRNPASILGTWLHYPTELEVQNVCETLQLGAAVINPEDP